MGASGKFGAGGREQQHPCAPEAEAEQGEKELPPPSFGADPQSSRLKGSRCLFWLPRTLQLQEIFE